MSIILDGTTGITTPGLTNTGTETILNLTTTGNTILGDATTDTLNVGAGGLVKDASGNVGIGTSSPAQKLDVNGTANFGNINTGNGVSTGTASIELGGLRTGDGVSLIDLHAVSGSDYATRIIRIGGTNGNFLIDNTGTGAFTLRTSGAGNMVFDTSNTERMRIDSSGNVGIGTSSPSAKLTVSSGSIRLSDGYEIGWGDNSSYIVGNGTSDTLQFVTASAERMRINSSGNVGIGVTTVNGKLDVADAFKVQSNGDVYGATGNAGAIMICGGGAYNAGGAIKLFGSSAGDIISFHTGSFTERMRIDSSGNLLVGKTTSSSYPVQAKGGGLDGSTTVSVSSGVTTTIYTSPQTVTAMFCVVFGDNGSVGFCDLIIFLPNVTPTVVSSNSIYGSPAARTYSVASTTQLRVNVANNLSVRVAVLGTCNV